MENIMNDIHMDKNNEVINRIFPIVENLFQGNSLFQVRLNKEEILQLLVKLFEKFSLEEFKTISDRELTRRIRKIMTVEAVSGTLNDLTPEQLEVFDAAVAGR
jgi:hypothetical protein